MQQVNIEGKAGVSQIMVGESLKNVADYIPDSSVYIISDKNVAHIYGHLFPQHPVYLVEPGEQSKDFTVIARIWQWLLDNEADRSSFILAIGGGVVSDIAGFVAATYMRGIPFGFVATTLLAQVDASVGGKNGINLNGYKNIIGTFTQPQFVICDTSLLVTLPEEEVVNGMAEVIKHALIKDKKKFAFLQENIDSVRKLEPSSINYLVQRSVEIKAAVVQADEYEKGERKLLNFGHTWGHAIEKVYKMPHGQAVSLGMVFASELSVASGFLTEGDKNLIIDLLTAYQLPIIADIDKTLVFDAMLKDKKRDKHQIHYILLDDIGNAFIKQTDVADLKKFVL